MSEAILRLPAPLDLPQTTPCGPEMNYPQWACSEFLPHRIMNRKPLNNRVLCHIVYTTETATENLSPTDYFLSSPQFGTNTPPQIKKCPSRIWALEKLPVFLPVQISWHGQQDKTIHEVYEESQFKNKSYHSAHSCFYLMWRCFTEDLRLLKDVSWVHLV